MHHLWQKKLQNQLIILKQNGRGYKLKGEVLKTPEVLERLGNEHEDRKEKKMKPNSSKYDIPLTGNKELISEGQCESDESDDNENDDTARIVCNQLWRTYKGKKSEPWLICDICDGYMSKCSPSKT